MVSNNRTIVFTLILATSLAACSLKEGSPTEEMLSSEETPTLEASTGIPLPTDLAVISTTSLIFMDFQDELNGWGISSTDGGNILRTQDGGSTWVDVTPPDLAEVSYATRLTVLDVNTAWALVPGADFYTGTLYQTLDGGASWISSPVPFGGAAIQFLDAEIGRAMADRGAGAGSNAVEIFQTSDGGLTWTSVFHNDPTQTGSSDSLPLGGIKNGMTFLDADTGWVTGSRPMDGDIYLYVTHDGGSSWALQPISLPAAFLTSQFYTFPPFFFGQDGFLPVNVYSPDSLVEQVFFVTHDGGGSWTADPGNASQVVTPAGQFSFADARHGFSWNGGPDLLYTRDGAQSWAGFSPTLDLSDSLSMIDFVNGRTGWALTGPDDSGQSRLYQTVDSGATWTQLIP